MYILTISGHEEDGAYAVLDDSGEQTVYFFEEEDDCIRYAGLLEAEDYPPMTVLKVDGNLAIKTCELHSYNYVIITSNDFVIPPRDDNIPKNQIS
jgi:hypothetical protein